LTTDQAHRRLEAEAERLQKAGNYAAAHDMRRAAADFARLVSRAEGLPASRRARSPLYPVKRT